MEVLYEDNHVIAVNKTCREIVQGDKTGDTPLSDMLKAWLKEKYCKPGNVFVGVTHRLDRPVSGVVLFAKTSKAAGRLSEQMKTGKFEKRYLTVLVGAPLPEKGKLENWLKKNTVNNMVYLCTQGTDGAKHALLEYEVLQKEGGLALTEIKLHTGRSHQIRVQTAGISHPVYGDMRYGGERARKGKLALWAYSLRFTHPTTGESLKFIIEPPKTSGELHSGTEPARIIFVDEGAAGIAQRVSTEAFGVEFERSGKEPSDAVVIDIAAADVREIIDKEVFGVEVTRSGAEPQPSLLGSSDAAGVATQVSPVTYSVKYRKCGTGRTKS